MTINNQDNDISRLGEIDFKKNPEEFNFLAEKIIFDFISSLPEDKQKKARESQFKLRGELAKFPNSMARWQRMQEMFIEDVFENEDGFLKVLSGQSKVLKLVKAKNKNEPAKIIPIK